MPLMTTSGWLAGWLIGWTTNWLVGRLEERGFTFCVSHPSWQPCCLTLTFLVATCPAAAVFVCKKPRGKSQRCHAEEFGAGGAWRAGEHLRREGVDACGCVNGGVRGVSYLGSAFGCAKGGRPALCTSRASL
eukprot:366085-Chlamydomonas_euryale.AAC.6